MDTLTRYADDFLLDCKAANLQPNTLRLYRRYLVEFITWLQPRNGDLQPIHIRGFLAELADSHNPAGVHIYYRVLKTWCRFLLREEHLDRNPFDKIRPLRLDVEPLRPVPVQDVTAMIATCDDSEIGLRDRALLLVLLDSGLRAGEVVGLNVNDVNLDTGAVLVTRSKSRKPRTTFIGEHTRKAVAQYLSARADGAHNSVLWFGHRRGREGRLQTSGLAQMLRRRARLAGVPRPSPHAFRRAFALNMLRGGADVVSISRLMGHGSLPVIMRYLRQEAGDLARVHSAYSPVDHLQREGITAWMST